MKKVDALAIIKKSRANRVAKVETAKRAKARQAVKVKVPLHKQKKSKDVLETMSNEQLELLLKQHGASE